jgi:hypothetical protein
LLGSNIIDPVGLGWDTSSDGSTLIASRNLLVSWGTLPPRGLSSNILGVGLGVPSDESLSSSLIDCNTEGLTLGVASVSEELEEPDEEELEELGDEVPPADEELPPVLKYEELKGESGELFLSSIISIWPGLGGDTGGACSSGIGLIVHGLVILLKKLGDSDQDTQDRLLLLLADTGGVGWVSGWGLSTRTLGAKGLGLRLLTGSVDGS